MMIRPLRNRKRDGKKVFECCGGGGRSTILESGQGTPPSQEMILVLKAKKEAGLEELAGE